MILNEPIFIKAMPRTGGTLLNTLLDAHSQVAMCYEIYEEQLRQENGEYAQVKKLQDDIYAAKVYSRDEVEAIKTITEKNLRTFLYRARRCGLFIDDVINGLQALLNNGTKDFSDISSRLNFIDGLMRRKMHKLDKQYWGGKTQADLYELHDRHPNASFFIMVRDVRDVFASMSNRGSFSYTAKQAGELWMERITQFREFVQKRRPNAMEIVYEDLIANPEETLKEICNIIGVDYEIDMLHYHEKDMTLFKNPHGHLSNAQLKNGLNNESVGRWKNDLTNFEIEELKRITKGLQE